MKWKLPTLQCTPHGTSHSIASATGPTQQHRNILQLNFALADFIFGLLSLIEPNLSISFLYRK